MVARFALPTLQHLHECLCPPLPWNTGSPGPVSAKAPTRPRTLRRAEALAKAASRATTPNEAERSLILTIFGHCGDTAFSSRRMAGRHLRQRTGNGFGRGFGVLKGLAMLIRSKLYGVRGGAAQSAPAIPAASAPTLLLGGLLLLIGP